MTREEELKLIRAFQAGQTSAFDALVEDFRTRAYSLAYQWTQNREDALDVCQDVFLRMHRALPKWSARASIFTWLYRVIINRAIDLKRKRARQRTVPADEPGSRRRLRAAWRVRGVWPPRRSSRGGSARRS